MDFGEKLRLARKSAGMTQKELAAAVGAKHNSVSNWEKGQNHPDTDTIRRLCTALRVEANYFFGEQTAAPRSDLEFALFGEVRQLSRQDQQDVLDFVRFKKSMREKKQQE